MRYKDENGRMRKFILVDEDLDVLEQIKQIKKEQKFHDDDALFEAVYDFYRLERGMSNLRLSAVIRWYIDTLHINDEPQAQTSGEDAR